MVQRQGRSPPPSPSSGRHLGRRPRTSASALPMPPSWATAMALNARDSVSFTLPGFSRAEGDAPCCLPPPAVTSSISRGYGLSRSESMCLPGERNRPVSRAARLGRGESEALSRTPRARALAQNRGDDVRLEHVEVVDERRAVLVHAHACAREPRARVARRATTRAGCDCTSHAPCRNNGSVHCAVDGGAEFSAPRRPAVGGRIQKRVAESRHISFRSPVLCVAGESGLSLSERLWLLQSTWSSTRASGIRLKWGDAASPRLTLSACS